MRINIHKNATPNSQPLSESDLAVVQSEDVPFDYYKRIVDRYVNSDWREINFQDRVVLYLIDSILVNFVDLSVVDVHAQFKNRESELHTRTFYAGEHTPDLLVVRNWNYANKQLGKEDYIAIVEVKSPKMDPLADSSEHTHEEMDEYLKICDRVILTDCYIWKFFESGKKVKSFTLHDKNDWKVIEVENPEFLRDSLGFSPFRTESKCWSDFVGFLKDFLCPRVPNTHP